MTKTISFNTGRKYTRDGQHIVATLHDDGVVTFTDHARMIDGEYDIHFPELFTPKDVIDMYDSRSYRSTKRSRDDGMLRGGCNTQRAEV